MGASTIDKGDLIQAVLSLFDEGSLGPAGPGTWYIDNEPGSGLLGTLEALDAEEASRPLSPGEPLSAASHAEHMRFGLSLANRAAAGEDAYTGVSWARSWDTRRVDDAAWKALLAALRKEVETMRGSLQRADLWDDADFRTGLIASVAHLAWHLGALRQGLGLVKAPKS